MYFMQFSKLGMLVSVIRRQKKLYQRHQNTGSKNLQIGSKSLPNVCEVWSVSSKTRCNFPKICDSCEAKSVERAHSDVRESTETVFEGGARYFVIFTNQFSKWTSVYPIEKMSDVLGQFKRFLPWLSDK